MTRPPPPSCRAYAGARAGSWAPRPRRQAHPLTVDELAQTVASIDTNAAIGVRDRAVLLLGYAAALRPGEVAALHLADVTGGPHGLLIAIRAHSARVPVRPIHPFTVAGRDRAWPAIRPLAGLRWRWRRTVPRAL